jgi:hypothetical protein
MTLLQVNSTAGDQLLNGDLFGFVVDTLTIGMPTPILALFVFGGIGISYYMVQRSFVIPAIMFILVGGVTITEIPLTFQRGIVSVLVIAMAALGYLLLQRVRV